jgi:cytoskeletal protein RodZ
MTLPLLKDVEPEFDSANAGTSGIGATLRTLREARGVSPAAAADRLKFTVRQVDALESEKWDDLPAGAPLRGFIRNYARFLEADADALLSMLDTQEGFSGTRHAAMSIGGSLSPRQLPMQGEPAQRPWGWFVIIVLLLLVAGFYAVERGWVPDSWLIFDWLKSLKK